MTNPAPDAKAEPFYDVGGITIHNGDCLDVLKTLEANSVDSVVTDPPAGISFMGKSWDGDKGGRDHWIAWMAQVAAECLRVIKPGGHALVWALPRTSHWTATAWENGGWEPREKIVHMFGSGFPKSLDVSKAITNRADPAKVRQIKEWLAKQFENSGKSKAEINRECGFTASDYLKTEPGNDAGGRATWHILLPYGEKWKKLKDVVGFPDDYDDEIERYGIIASQRSNPKENREIYGKYSGTITDYELTDAARQYSGWGSALKPASEDWWLFRKPIEGTIAGNVLKWGTGGINIDASRIKSADGVPKFTHRQEPSQNCYGDGKNGSNRTGEIDTKTGRFPANVLLSHCPSDESGHGGCKCIGVKRVKSASAGKELQATPTNPIKMQASEFVNVTRFGDANGLETVDSYECVAGCPCGHTWTTGELTSCPDCGCRKTAWLCPVAELDQQSGSRPGCGSPSTAKCESNFRPGQGAYQPQGPVYDDGGSGASRFFKTFPPFRYQAKAPGDERRKSAHPTIKPLALMQYLVRLICPAGGVVLDPFAGSGSTIEAARAEHCKAIGVELSAEYCGDIVARLRQNVFTFSEAER